MAESTRSKDRKVTGPLSPLPQNVLPTKFHVLQQLQIEKENLVSAGNKKPPVKSFVEPVISQLILVWKKASIPTIEERSIDKALTTLWTEGIKSTKSECSKQKWETSKNSLFDICSCKCEILPCSEFFKNQDHCQDHHSECKCQPKDQVPANELSFLYDQRGARKMFMCGVDKKTTKTLQDSEKRKAAFEEQQKKEENRKKTELEENKKATANFFPDSSDPMESSETTDPSWIPETPSSTQIPKTRNYHPLPKTAMVCDRRGVSSEAAADICNAYAEDMGFLTSENKLTMTVDKSKINRWRKTGRANADKEEIKKIGSKPVTGFYFDGKKDATLTQVQKGNRLYTKTVIEDHYVMLEEPGSTFLGHEVPLSGHGISIGVKLFRFLKSKGWDRDLLVVGADGCNVNTGNKHGALVYLEKLLGKPLHWYICMLHLCELPLRALIRDLDGGTSGPFTLKGPIGSTLNDDLTELQVTSFSKIPNPDFPQVAEEEGYKLSKDQDYLLRMTKAIMEGHVPEELLNEEPGNLNHSRWNTLANRYQRKYVSTSQPSKQFKDLIHAIVVFYAPSWFQVKTHPKCTDGPKNLMAMIRFSRKLDKRLQKTVQRVLQNNGYMAHSNAILLSMVTEENKPELRARAVNQIKTIRMKAEQQTQVPQEAEEDGRGVDEVDDDHEADDSEDDGLQLDNMEKQAIASSQVRPYTIPKISFEASEYLDLIDCEAEKLSEPPLMMLLTNEQLTAIQDSPLKVADYPCHIQAVERAVCVVTEASASVIGQDARDGFVIQRIQSQKELIMHATKKDFFPRLETHPK